MTTPGMAISNIRLARRIRAAEATATVQIIDK